jgi:hypothetical protein
MSCTPAAHDTPDTWTVKPVYWLASMPRSCWIVSVCSWLVGGSFASTEGQATEYLPLSICSVSSRVTVVMLAVCA